MVAVAAAVRLPSTQVAKLVPAAAAADIRMVERVAEAVLSVTQARDVHIKTKTERVMAVAVEVCRLQVLPEEMRREPVKVEAACRATLQVWPLCTDRAATVATVRLECLKRQIMAMAAKADITVLAALAAMVS